jgi:2-polyprenyl-6-methoxyphenol hydroxylase-like FAD-dependent oxidoreductase
MKAADWAGHTPYREDALVYSCESAYLAQVRVSLAELRYRQALQWLAALLSSAEQVARVYDISTQPIWRQGPVVLVGDAIHAVSPNAGQGPSLAVEDAIVLAKCLRDISDLEQAFATYERLRRAHGSAWAQRGSGEGHDPSYPGVVSGQARAALSQAFRQPCRTRLGLLLPGRLG